MIPVPGYDGRYWATQYGEIVGPRGTQLIPRRNHAGYLRVCTSPAKGVKHRLVSVHRLVALAYIPNPLGLATVDHIDGNKENNAPCNLRWMSFADNNRRKSKLGLPLGVVRREGGKTYRAVKHINGVCHRSPTFGTPEEAGQWYTQKVR